RPPPCSTLFPYTTLFRSLSGGDGRVARPRVAATGVRPGQRPEPFFPAALLNQQGAPVGPEHEHRKRQVELPLAGMGGDGLGGPRSEEHTSELQSLAYLVC